MIRKETIAALRPDIPSIKRLESMTDIEKFQNDVIRPILKYQHDVIVGYAISKAVDRNSKFPNLIAIEKERYLDKVTLKDSKIKQALNGMVIGLMTIEEMNKYLAIESEYKRRINTMIRERIVSTF
ncbi:hypothetical protein N9C25_06965 [Saprospiraceae bacterium]|nr:hypothetical protein [Saprospiraceae bacterium]MDA9332613.1 hypothetical protein [Saprospiraceae bacterium]MDA9873948.1 hypothetical protein [Saprospiraceae bacterium]MDB4824328.1 hypothetical protein [Saprospiraceae bacterium]MDB9914651.1 hypothetical protein [Saprospiraceae bacterium]